MIQNLNQVSFQGFGTILPERKQSTVLNDQPSQKSTMNLVRGDVPIYRTTAGTWLYSGAGMTVLSVSADGDKYLHFYLDKPVLVKVGVLFCLSPMQQTSSAELASAVPPVQVGVCPGGDDFQVRHRIRVEGLYTFFYQEKEKGFFFPGEAHPMLELTYVDQGCIHSVVDGQDLLLEQGDMAIYGPGQWHMQYADINVTASFVTITFDLEGESLTGILNRKFKTPQRAVALLQQMLRERDRPDLYANDMMICMLSQVLLVLLRENGSPEGTKLRTANAIHSENEIIRRAQQYISTHIRERLTVPIVARHADVSPSYLTALFRKNLQISPGEYIRRIKLQESKQMIREDNMNFTEIAAALQYSTVHHFSRQFKEKFGITPTEYAKSIR